jgi:hypothetical protein
LFQNQVITAATVPADAQVLNIVGSPQLGRDGQPHACAVKHDKLDTHRSRENFFDPRVEMIAVTKHLVADDNVFHSWMLLDFHRHLKCTIDVALYLSGAVLHFWLSVRIMTIAGSQPLEQCRRIRSREFKRIAVGPHQVIKHSMKDLFSAGLIDHVLVFNITELVECPLRESRLRLLAADEKFDLILNISPC